MGALKEWAVPGLLFAAGAAATIAAMEASEMLERNLEARGAVARGTDSRTASLAPVEPSPESDKILAAMSDQSIDESPEQYRDDLRKMRSDAQERLAEEASR